MGGDEFTVVLQCTSTGELTQWQRVLSACLDEPLSRRGQMIPMGASIGRAFGPVHDRDLAPLLSHADEELYAVKRSRRARACLRPVKVA